MNSAKLPVPSYTSAPVYFSFAVFLITFVPEELQRLSVIAKLLKIKSITLVMGIVHIFWSLITLRRASLLAQLVKNLPATQETWVQSLGWEDPLEEGMATHSSILVWRIRMDIEAWRATVHSVTESNMTEQLSTAQHSTWFRETPKVQIHSLSLTDGSVNRARVFSQNDQGSYPSPPLTRIYQLLSYFNFWTSLFSSAKWREHVKQLLRIKCDCLKQWFPGPVVSTGPGSLLKCKFSGPIPDLLNQKLWEWGPAICVLTSAPGDSDAHTGMRSPCLKCKACSKHPRVPFSFFLFK